MSIKLKAAFCIEAFEEAPACCSEPDVFSTNQGSHFASAKFFKAVTGAEVKISMDGKGAWRVNIFVERIWRTIEYEEVNLHA